MIKQALAEYQEDLLDAQRGEEAYQHYLDSGRIAHDLHSVVKELGLDSSELAFPAPSPGNAVS